jgi:hypothetical protein
MNKVFSPGAQQVYLVGHHQNIPADARPITAEEERQFVGNRPAGFLVSIDPAGELVHTPAPEVAPTADGLCHSIDLAADAARVAVVGAQLRDEEYKLAATEASAFRAAGYPADAVPRTVAAWAINGRTPQQAADSILTEAAAYTGAIYGIREVRLQAKESIRTLMADGSVEMAKGVAEEAIAAIGAAVIGVGNNLPPA